MTSESEAIREELRRLVGEVLARKRSPLSADGIADATSLMRDLGVDSLDLLQLAAAVEKRFGIRLSDQERRGVDNFGALAAAILRRLDGA